MLNVEYLDNCGYTVETESGIYVFDYVGGQLPSHYLFSKKPTYFFVTSTDEKRFSDSILAYRKPVFYGGSKNVTGSIDVQKVEPGDILHLGHARVYVYQATRSGVYFCIEEKHRVIVHGGDLNNWHWSRLSTQRQIKAAVERFENAVIPLHRFETIDLMMFSIDPEMMQDYDLGARTVIKRFKPKYFFPMQFGESIHNLESFLNWTEQIASTQCYKPLYKNHIFRIEA